MTFHSSTAPLASVNRCKATVGVQHSINTFIPMPLSPAHLLNSTMI
jgi:hypothetical protein